MRIMAIYGIVNPINRKIYVGSSVNIRTRMFRHLNLLNLNCHQNEHLQNAWNKYEIDFEFIILEIVENKATLLKREQFWIDLTKSYDKDYGYNKQMVAGSPLGTKDSEATKLKKSQWQIGRKLPEETKIRQSVAGKGKTKSDNHRKKLSEANLGKTQSKEQVNKAIASRKLNSSWKHPWGRHCVCDECMERKREYKRNGRKANA